MTKGRETAGKHNGVSSESVMENKKSGKGEETVRGWKLVSVILYQVVGEGPTGKIIRSGEGNRQTYEREMVQAERRASGKPPRLEGA